MPILPDLRTARKHEHGDDSYSVYVASNPTDTVRIHCMRNDDGSLLLPPAVFIGRVMIGRIDIDG